jgi:hypothetical protein
MLELVRYQTKPMLYGIFLVRNRTKLMDAGMPMPALVFWMPMPSYVQYTVSLVQWVHHLLPT